MGITSKMIKNLSFKKIPQTQYEIWAADYFDYRDIEWNRYAVYTNKEQAEAELERFRREAGGEYSIIKFRLQKKRSMGMSLIKKYFEEYFSAWEIKLPVKTFNERLNGHILDGSGWLIQYCFGIENNLEYMDFYAYHNMTNDRHIRIYENGEAKDLPAYWSGYCLDSDGSGKKAYEEHNAEVTKSLIDKGFDQFTINMAISAGMVK